MFMMLKGVLRGCNFQTKERDVMATKNNFVENETDPRVKAEAATEAKEVVGCKMVFLIDVNQTIRSRSGT